MRDAVTVAKFVARFALLLALAAPIAAVAQSATALQTRPVCSADDEAIQTLQPTDEPVSADRYDRFLQISRDGSTGSPTATKSASVSADGRYVAFEGGWNGFGSVSSSSSDILVKDLQSGTFTNEHRNSNGQFGASGSGAPVIAADGSVVAFVSASGNLVPGQASGALYDIYVASLAGPAIERVSTGDGDIKARGGRSLNPDLSGDGRYVVFESTVADWAAGGSDTTVDIFLKDRASRSITRISTSLSGTDGNGDSINPRISQDGRFVVFQSAATNLSADDTNAYSDIFVWDRNSGALTNITMGAASRNTNNHAVRPDVGAGDGSGATVVFESARAFVAADTNNALDIFAYNMTTRAFRLVSARANGATVAVASEEASISDNGRFVSFTGYSDGLVPGDSNGTRDVFVKNLASGAIARVSQNGAIVNNQASLASEISANGSWIVFESGASNLIATDANGTFPDVFRVANPLMGDPAAAASNERVYAVNGVQTMRSGSSAILPPNVENLRLTGSTNADGTGNAQNNQLVGNIAVNKLTGLGGDDAIHGCGGNDVLDGGDGNDLLDGSAGDDRMAGGAGEDIYVTDSAADNIVETVNNGIDTVQSAVTWTLQPTLENLELTGSAAITGGGNNAANNITGNDAANTLNGASGDDVLDGRAGDDLLIGGAGSDQLSGGDGADVFVFNSSIGADTVRDYVQGSDKLRVSMAGLRIGDADVLIEGALQSAGPGGFSAAAELVDISAPVADLSAGSVLAAIGSATSNYMIGDRRVFLLHTATSSGLFLFIASTNTAAIAATDLLMLATLEAAPSVGLSDIVFSP